MYGPHTTDRRGGTATSDFYDAGGTQSTIVWSSSAQTRRTSPLYRLFLQPGGGEIAPGMSGTELDSSLSARTEDHFTVDDFRLCIDGKSSGAVRVCLDGLRILPTSNGFSRLREASSR